MNKSILTKSAAILLIGIAAVGCSHDFNMDEQKQEAQQALDHAQETLGFYIPENQDWVMSSLVSANLPISGEAGKTYTVKVYSNEPVADGIGYILAQEEVMGGQNFVSTFRIPDYKTSFVVGITDSEGNITYKRANVVNDQMTAFAEAADARTRSITVNGDTYSTFTFPTTEELTAAFPTAIPSGADEVADLWDIYKDTEYTNEYGTFKPSDLFAVYQNLIGAGHNLKVTSSGEVSIGANYMNIKDGVYQYYNVYVKVNGNLTINRIGDPHFNLYILEGNVTLPAEFGEMSGIISVAEGATLNDQRNSIAANGGVRLYNRGTVNATNTEKYDIGNKSTVFNENKFYVSGPLSYSPGAGNASYFINYSDDAVLTAPSMTLNSECHFFTDGKVTITGQTKVTQVDITWINNGHYTTGSMVFSAHNGTFYNYCQLKVINNCAFTDGHFNMMDNSYAEFGTGLFNNFHVVMGDNAGFNVKGGTKWGQQGAGINQGFYAKNDGAEAYVRLAGMNYVPAHKGSAFHVSGANLTLAYENMKFYEYFNEVNMYSTYDAINYWNETTAEALADNKDERTTWDLHNVTKIITGDNFSKTGFTVKEGECAATWTGTPPKPTPPVEEKQIWSYAFEDSNLKSDYDMNDVVIQVQETLDGTGLQVTLMAAGCEYDNTVYLNRSVITWQNGTTEVHQALYAGQAMMVNTGSGPTCDPSKTTITIPKPAGYDPQTAQWSIVPSGGDKAGQHIDIAGEGESPCGIVIPAAWKWPRERKNICVAYPDFAEWGSNPDRAIRKAISNWYENPVSRFVY